MYVIFIIGILIASYQIYNLVKLNSKKNEASKFVGAYKHSSHIVGFYISLITNIILYMIPFFRNEFMYILWASPIMANFIIKYYINSQKIELYDTGIQVFGNFIEWKNITSAKLADDEIVLVTNDKDPLNYTITKLKDSDKCYRKIQELAPYVSSIKNSRDVE